MREKENMQTRKPTSSNFTMVPWSWILITHNYLRSFLENDKTSIPLQTKYMRIWRKLRCTKDQKPGARRGSLHTQACISTTQRAVLSIAASQLQSISGVMPMLLEPHQRQWWDRNAMALRLNRCVGSNLSSAIILRYYLNVSVPLSVMFPIESR